MDSCVLKLVLIGGALVTLCSCSDKRQADFGTNERVFPVKGEVLVNGKPVVGLQVMLYPKDKASQGANKEDPAVRHGTVDKDGKVVFTTYEANDGVPVGDYKVTFEWTPKIAKNRREDVLAEDKFAGKYADPAASEIQLTVGETGENDLGKINLEGPEEAAAETPAN